MSELQKPEHTVVHYTDEFPSALRTAEEVVDMVPGMTAERLIELADAGYLPHFRVDGGLPLFKSPEVKRWLAQNLVARCEGRKLPDAIRIVWPAPAPVDRPPASISNIVELQQMPRHGYQPGVYFLCKGDEVVYVGQSIMPAARIAQHGNDPVKDFDRVYLLPVPISELNDVEAAFIRHLMPAQQGGLRAGKKSPVAPAGTRPVHEVISLYIKDSEVA